MKNNNKVINSVLKKHIKEVLLLVIVITIGVIVGCASPYIWGKIIDALTAKKFQLLKKFLLIQLFLSVITNLFVYIESYLGGILTPKLINKIKIKILEKIINMKCKNLDQYTNGELLNRIENDVTSIVNIYIDFWSSLIQILFNFIFSLVVILNISQELSIIALLSFVFSYLVNMIFKKKYSKITHENKKINDRYLGFVNETINDIVGIKSNKLEKNIIKKFTDYLQKKFEIDKQLITVNNNISILRNMIAAFFNIFSLFIGGMLICRNIMTLGNLIAFNEYLERLFEAIKKILLINMNFNTLDINNERLGQILNCDSEFSYDNEEIISQDIKSIKFEKLSFSYNKKRPILINMNLEIDQPGLYTFVGTNGSGKSTILKILFGLYQRDDGYLYFNNKNLDDYNLKEIRKKICYVSKKAYLFNDSLYQNITLGNENISKEDVMTACFSVGLKDFMDTNVDGINTNIGEMGEFLSSGLKQKVILARSLVQKYSLIMLDEITSDLDMNAELQITKLIKQISTNKIVLLISHRPAPILVSDKIFILEKGKIKESGTHEELIKKSASYQNLFAYIKEIDKEDFMA